MTAKKSSWGSTHKNMRPLAMKRRANKIRINKLRGNEPYVGIRVSTTITGTRYDAACVSEEDFRLDYITISSSANATDFGDLRCKKFTKGGLVPQNENRI